MIHYDINDVVYHDLQPEWGYGYVRQVDPDNSILVHWPDRKSHPQNTNIFRYFYEELVHIVKYHT